MSEEMTCPVKVKIQKVNDITLSENQPCIKEKCAWWYEENDCCVFIQIAYCLVDLER